MSVDIAQLGTRAVERPVDPGNSGMCPECLEVVKFRARHKDRQVIANVYVDGKWDRVEQFHADCYTKAGAPHGPISADQRHGNRTVPNS